MKPLTFRYFLRFFALTALFAVSSCGVALAQNSPKAKKHYTKLQKLKESGKATFKEITDLTNKSVNAERELGDNADFDFIGNLQFQYARYFISEDYYGLASKLFYFSAISFQTGGNFNDAQRALHQSAMFQDSSLKYQSKYLENGDSLGRRFTRLPIHSVDSAHGDTTWYTMQFGTRDSIYLNQTGSVVTIYDSKNPKRQVEFYGTATVEHVEFGRSHWYVVIDEEFKKKGIDLQAGDLVYTKAIYDHNSYQGLISDMVALGVTFLDDYRHPMMSHRSVLYTLSEKQENLILDMMVTMVQGTAKSLYKPGTTTSNMTPLEGGGFDGINMWEAMLKTTREDMKVFLRFVKDYPGKYMGRRFRIDETYATWIINSTPVGDSETEIIRDKYDQISNSNDLDAWTQQFGRYMDVSEMDYSFITDQVYSYISEEKYIAADSLTDQWVQICNTLKMDSLHLEFKVLKSFILSSREKYDDAIDGFREILKVDSQNVNAIWYLANTYLQNDEYSRALKQYQILKDMYPYYAGGHGMYGWTLLKMARNQEALGNLKKAYELDSFSATYIMNYAHGVLIMGKNKEARRIYERLFENMQDTATFYEGLIADFDFFIENGRKADEFTIEKRYAKAQWRKQHRFKTIGNQFFERGKVLEDKEQYANAALQFDSAILYEKQGLVVRYKTLRNYHRWAAYNYYKDKNHPMALERYINAWEINRNHINDASMEIKDLEAISNEYSWLDNDVMEDMYEQMQHAAQRKLKSQRRSNNFYMLSIGLNGDSISGYALAEQDASKIAELAMAKTGLVFDESHVDVLHGKNATKHNIDSAIDFVINNSLAGDCFMLYFSGKTKNDNILLDSQIISNQDILVWLSQMSATKKIILIDAENASLVSDYISEQNEQVRDFSTKSVTFMISNGRVEMPEAQGGLFTSYVMNALNGAAATSWSNTYLEASSDDKQIAYVTAKSLEGFMYGTMSLGNLQFDLKSYSTGVDFPLTFVNAGSYSIDTLPPMIYMPNVISSEGKRGGQTKRIAVVKTVNGQALDESGIAEIRVNGQLVNFSQNGKFTLSNKFAKTSIKLVISAKDKNGNEAIDSFIVNLKEDNFEDPSLNDRDPINYALLFATNEYDEWTHLKNPTEDVRKIAQLLRQNYGFKVEVVENATIEEMTLKLEEYMDKTYAEQDQLFIYFAGHGLFDTKNRGFVVAKDSKKDDHTKRSYLRFKQLTGDLNESYGCNHVFLALDVCFGGAAFDKFDAVNIGGSSLEEILQNKEKFIRGTLKITSRILVTSGGIEYVPDESVFAKKFIETLKTNGAEKNGILTLDDFADNFQTLATIQDSEIPTTPQYGYFGDHQPYGDFLFIYQNASKPKSDGMTKTQILAEKKQ